MSKQEQGILLNDYHLTTIIDLRSGKERDERPNDDLPVKTVHLSVIDELAKDNKASKRSLSSAKGVDETHQLMADLYEEFIRDEVPRSCYRKFVEVFLAQEEGAILFHCFAGKDRTGIGAAVILTLLGCSEEDIMHDYLLTNELRREANESLLAEIRHQLNEEQVASFLIGMGVDESYLRRAFTAATELYGSFYGYCTQGLGFGEAEVARLREKYLTN